MVLSGIDVTIVVKTAGKVDKAVSGCVVEGTVDVEFSVFSATGLENSVAVSVAELVGMLAVVDGRKQVYFLNQN